MADRIQIRRGLASAWTTSNPVLAQGEIGLETDTVKIKIGNGSASWDSLSYFTGSSITRLDSLSDTSLSGIATQDILIYSGSAWVNTPFTSGSGVSQLSSLSDVGVIAYSNGFILVANGASYEETDPTTAGISTRTYASNIASTWATDVNSSHEAVFDHTNALKIRGRTIADSPPTDNYVLGWSDTTSAWQPVVQSGSGVTQLESLTDVTIGGIATQDTLIYNGSVWINTPFTGSSGVDATALQGRTVANTDPTDNYVLGWNNTNSMWVPIVQSGSGVTKLASLTDIGQLAYTNGYILVANGASYDETDPTTAGLSTRTYASDIASTWATDVVSSHLDTYNHATFINSSYVIDRIASHEATYTHSTYVNSSYVIDRIASHETTYAHSTFITSQIPTFIMSTHTSSFDHATFITSANAVVIASHEATLIMSSHISTFNHATFITSSQADVIASHEATLIMSSHITTYIHSIYARTTEAETITAQWTFTNTYVITDDIKIPSLSLGSPTYSTLKDFMNSFGSTGRKTGGIISAVGSSEIAVSAGTGFIKATDDDNADILFFDFPAPSNIAIPASSERFIGVEYNSGTPQVVARTTWDWDLDTEFPLGRVVNQKVNGSDSISLINNPWWVTDGITNIIERVRGFGRMLRDETVGGLIIAVTGTRNLAVTEGTLWANLNEFEMPALDTSSTGTFKYMWYSSATGWQASDATQYSVTNYNVVTESTLQTLSANRYACLWIYACACNLTYAVLYPQRQHTSAAAAEAEATPSLIPLALRENGTLLGRIIIKKSTDAPIEVQSTFDTVFSASLAADHGNLTGLSDDDHELYPNITGAESIYGTWSFSTVPIFTTNPASPLAGANMTYVQTFASGVASSWATLVMSSHISTFNHATFITSSIASDVASTWATDVLSSHLNVYSHTTFVNSSYVIDRIASHETTYAHSTYVNSSYVIDRIASHESLYDHTTFITSANADAIASHEATLIMSTHTSSWSHITQLASLTDVSMDTPATADFIMYTGTSWVNTPFQGGSGYTQLQSMSDVAIVTPATMDLLLYSGTAWANTPSTFVTSAEATIISSVVATLVVSSHISTFDHSTFVTSTYVGSSYVTNATYNAHTILQATADNSPVALTIGEQTVVGRITGGNIVALTVAQLQALFFSSALPENIDITLAIPSTDGKYSGITEMGTAGAALSFGDCCYFAVADSKWELADADSAAKTFGKLGICVHTASEDIATKILLWGRVSGDTAFPTFTIGAPVFLSTTDGDVTNTAPSGTGDCIRIIGYGNSANELFFCPSNDWFELA